MTDPQIAEIAAWRKVWCNWLHGGGHIHRDEQGRLNWRCSKCGRWSANPVLLPEERHATGQSVAAYLKEQSSHAD